jgi:YD repeat-containing protein
MFRNQLELAPLCNVRSTAAPKTANPSASTLLHMSAELLLTNFQYDAAGNQSQVIDPAGTITMREFDDAGRLVKLVENAGVIIQLGEDGKQSTTEDNQLLFEE